MYTLCHSNSSTCSIMVERNKISKIRIILETLNIPRRLRSIVDIYRML
jgi:hypothetical protein